LIHLIKKNCNIFLQSLQHYLVKHFDRGAKLKTIKPSSTLTLKRHEVPPHTRNTTNFDVACQCEKLGFLYFQRI